MTNKQTVKPDRLQGPLRKVDVLDLLAWENNKIQNRAAESGMHASDGPYVAWQWLTNIVLDKPAGHLPLHAKQSLIRVQTCPDIRARIDYTLTYRTKYSYAS